MLYLLVDSLPGEPEDILILSDGVSMAVIRVKCPRKLNGVL